MATLTLVSGDGQLVELINTITATLKNCIVDAYPSLDDLDHAQLGSSALLVIHVDRDSHSKDVERALKHLALTRCLPTLLICEDHDSRQQLRFLRQGVMECLYRPIDIRRLALLINSITLRATYQHQDPAPSDSDSSNYEHTYAMASAPMQRVLESAKRIAVRDLPVLLVGETGVGKTYLARMIHELSPRRKRSFVSVNCAAIPETLIENELFGHMKGAYTGADEDYKGRFAQAGDGTLLLDEIDSLPYPAQAKLLRALDERVFEPVGSSDSLPLRARLIAASNQALDQAVEARRFRPDLYYRLNVVEILIPPLRERKSEIRRLAVTLLAQHAEKYDLSLLNITDRALDVLENYNWPGNIRELCNALECAVNMCDEMLVDVGHLPAALQRNHVRSSKADSKRLSAARHEAQMSLADARKRGELERLLDVLLASGNNRTRAAKLLGISRTALYKKLNVHGLA